ncbi:MAG: hypothetical protein NC102_10460 [Clostridium sp.]|nr:hypothetical protein [Clostridium sp.]
METFVIVLSLLWSILVIILFFKVWGMTNNVAEMLQLMKMQYGKEAGQDSDDPDPAEDVNPDNTDDTIINNGDVVYEKKSGRKMIVERAYAGMYSCIDAETRRYISNFYYKDITKKPL